MKRAFLRLSRLVGLYTPLTRVPRKVEMHFSNDKYARAYKNTGVHSVSPTRNGKLAHGRG
jgi:hypothetical protein